MNYRADIDGLRAIAVLPVVLYHAGSTSFSGGYVGVDVFFVISGFLITSIIQKDILQNRFSIASFYERRIKRIFPALFTVLAASSIFAFYLFTPDDLVAFAKSLVATSLFASNIQFLRESGYFDGPAHMKPLLHTWSLAVEEQFYIVFPLFLMLLSKWGKSRLVNWLVPIGVISFAASVWGVSHSPSATFYLAPTRAWELLLGSLLAVGAVRKIQNNTALEAAALFGIGMIAWSTVMFSESTSFPGLNALLPTLGASLIIYTGSCQPTFVSRFLSLRPVVFVGLISYSLYLWHWPLLVFARAWKIHPLSHFEAAGVVTISFLLAILSWRFIEKPFRSQNIFATRKRLFIASAATMAAAILAGIYVWRGQGLPDRLPANVVKLSNARHDSNPQRAKCHASDENPIPFEKKCVYGAPGTAPQTAIWGDSFAAELAVALGEVAARHGQALLHVSYSHCLPILNLGGKGDACGNHNAEILEKLVASTTINKIVLIARYKLYSGEELKSFRDLSVHLSKSGKKIFIIYPLPEADVPVPTMLARYELSGIDISEAFIPEKKFLSLYGKTIEFFENFPPDEKIYAIRPDKLLCRESRCRVESGGAPLYFDDFHLSLAGGKFISPSLEVVFRDANSGSK